MEEFHNGTFQMKVDGNNLYIYSTDCKWSEGGTSVWASVKFFKFIKLKLRLPE